MGSRVLFVGALAVLLAAAPGRPAHADEGVPVSGVRFRDVTEGSGIAWRHTFGDERFDKILKATGSGVALLDYDKDGDLDVYFVDGTWLPGICRESARAAHEGATNRLYRNDGFDAERRVVKFTDVTATAGVGDKGYGMGAVVADYDNDGDPDLYVTNYGPNVLYRNRGDGTFEDVTAKAGIAGPEKLNGWVKWSTNAVFLDYDRDGRLDLFVCDYLAFDPAFDAYYGPEGFPGPLSYLGQPSILYRQRADGTFEDVTEKAGVFRKDGRGMGASIADVNNDGWPDVYEANDAMANFLWLNRRDGTFENVAEESLCARGQGGENTSAMHAAVADFDDDGWIDLFVTDIEYFSLFRNVTGARPGGGVLFRDVTLTSGIAKACGQYDGWGGFFFDYDHDGRRDLFVATGASHRPEGTPSVVLRNVGGGRFEDVSLALDKRAFFERRLSRGATAGDLDGDGDLDVVRVNVDVKAAGKEGLPTILLNEGGNAAGSWIVLKFAGTKSNRDGIGARVRVTAAGRTWTADVTSTTAYLSSTQAQVHLGLGAAKVVDRVEVDWPSGTKQAVTGLEVGRVHVIREQE